jgi:hypothetical protein
MTWTVHVKGRKPILQHTFQTGLDSGWILRPYGCLAWTGVIVFPLWNGFIPAVWIKVFSGKLILKADPLCHWRWQLSIGWIVNHIHSCAYALAHLLVRLLEIFGLTVFGTIVGHSTTPTGVPFDFIRALATAHTKFVDMGKDGCIQGHLNGT